VSLSKNHNILWSVKPIGGRDGRQNKISLWLGHLEIKKMIYFKGCGKVQGRRIPNYMNYNSKISFFYEERPLSPAGLTLDGDGGYRRKGARVAHAREIRIK
jgi:hypothetical protein